MEQIIPYEVLLLLSDVIEQTLEALPNVENVNIPAFSVKFAEQHKSNEVAPIQILSQSSIGPFDN